MIEYLKLMESTTSWIVKLTTYKVTYFIFSIQHVRNEWNNCLRCLPSQFSENTLYKTFSVIRTTEPATLLLETLMTEKLIFTRYMSSSSGLKSTRSSSCRSHDMALRISGPMSCSVRRPAYHEKGI